MLANIQIHKYLTISPSTNSNLEVVRTLMRRNIPPHKLMVTYMCGQDVNVSWFRNWTVWVNWMEARQYSRCHDRHVHRLTSPPAWDHWAVLLQSNACNNSTHHQLLAFGWTTHNGLWMEYLLSVLRPGLGSNVSSVWCVALFIIVSVLEKAAITLYICASCTSPNSISTISRSALHENRGQPHTHTLNTNHGNPSVAQSFWCWEVDQTKVPECSTADRQLHNVTASLI